MRPWTWSSKSSGTTVVLPAPGGACKTAWPEARFTIVTEANHAATPSAPALSLALRDATDRLRDSMPALAA